MQCNVYSLASYGSPSFKSWNLINRFKGRVAVIECAMTCVFGHQAVWVWTIMGLNWIPHKTFDGPSRLNGVWLLHQLVWMLLLGANGQSGRFQLSWSDIKWSVWGQQEDTNDHYLRSQFRMVIVDGFYTFGRVKQWAEWMEDSNDHSMSSPSTGWPAVQAA